jgi:hypothetical protein
LLIKCFPTAPDWQAQSNVSHNSFAWLRLNRVFG